MTDTVVKPRTKAKPKTETAETAQGHPSSTTTNTPREFVVTVLKGEFRMTEDQAYKVMLTAHQRGVCRGCGLHQGRCRKPRPPAPPMPAVPKGYPLLFTTEPEE